ncbi:hypothetical protein DFA_01061 [Cavenderia fasciculata]|uniref:Transmembrane protein n=1 Tax=Cavenderia fasciculata TaxID=261658 RepID=F4PQL9_CACFS|nr:uncharacterized protein DFA_01061 [Cavenderia fasciculata]EGG21186.1 hypothetical protein DFA_01061 [Cavenderia fasciculata]|eukprot:XP_004359036.1 hypothetical protein DFA_01061 [Cavenderia fasciculata]
MGILDGADNRVKIIYLLCILLCIMAIVSAVSTFLIGIIICIATFLVAAAGAMGARFNSFRLLWFFMAGLGCLVILSVISIIITFITKSGFSWWMIKDIILIALYGGGIFTAFLMRGRSFRYNPSAPATFQKL